ncbi:hypothetical protein WJ0W_002712 [Paenibacillus melissococcoides]|uniref:Uncharacterized protein n=1 Tax=Paenibacillus melissococcoides TaxID=2912268 RepID=A0ABN8U7S1_9BACL|nr:MULTISPECIES: hypothetical protein [Paenibacillus]MEB9894654.1 hypothetical protein [Bacillus cereus]CAH8245477.1 hypothetical protein WJ0W_002712 [Paenibacillus melissococcoides]CAH8711060.1 hypothetical protein WDD9_002791 [Paenibacillus melissococcoides]CAH8711826.1 hypothetical protein HTL2_003092 [Paenibacillus melissococcoides]GIO78806.1 hypothetical protein J6TS7_24160 [Paenibacillus dendritiformis]
MRWIPARWSRKWIRWELCHALVLTLGLWGVRYVAAGAEPAFAIGYGCGVLAETALAIYYWIQCRRNVKS